MRNYISASTLLILFATTICFADAPTYKITTKRADDRVEVKSQDDRALLIIHSPMGISHANIERTAAEWPDKVIIRLRLNGLESVKLSTNGRKLYASVSSQNGEARVWLEGHEDEPLNAKSEYWLEIRMLDGQGKRVKSVPLNGGCFEMQLPKKFFEGNPQSFKIEWIDFYRN